jgi:hypothetical protein
VREVRKKKKLIGVVGGRSVPHGRAAVAGGCKKKVEPAQYVVLGQR